MAIPRLIPDTTALLVVDLQEKLLPIIDGAGEVEARAGLLVDGFNALGLAVLATEQYPAGLGSTVASIADRLGDRVARHEKLRFSASIEPIHDDLRRVGARSVVVCGIESHVCVLQTALDLADAGYIVAAAEDACGSRRRGDHDAALRRLTQSGVLMTTAESAIMELVGAAGTARFKAVLPLIK